MTTLDPDDGHMELINRFASAPENADVLAVELSCATGSRIRHVLGFVSANLHAREDRGHVAKYDQRQSRVDTASADDR